MNIYKSAEDYLEAMLMLREERGYIRSIDVADKLGVTKPSVSYATKRLRENGYIAFDPAGMIVRLEPGLEIAERICALCREPMVFETLLQKLFTDYGLTMNFEQYVLVGSTVRSYLAWLRDAGRLDVSFEENRMLWSRKP